MYGSLLPLLLLIFGIGLGARAVGGSEDDGTLELLLSNPVTRLRVAVERYAAAVALVVVLGAVTEAAVLVLGPPFDILEGIALQKLLLANAAAVMLALVHLSLAYAVGCVTGRRAPAISIATAVAVSGYLLQGLAAVSDAADAVSVVSPWGWYLDRNLLASGPGPVAFVVPLLVSVALATAGVSRFLGRDLR
jgi:ABC-2 type transport system permease protein